MKRIALVLAGTAAVAAPVVAVSTAGADNAPAPAKAAQSDKTIVEIAASDKQFSTLVSLVKKAGLVDTLSSGEYTVFAPTNAAFKKVPKKTLNALAKNKAKLTKVLTYHVVPGKVMAADVVKLKKAKTVNGKSIRISVRGGNVFLNKSTKVTKTDIEASNGVIHVINKVLIP